MNRVTDLPDKYRELRKEYQGWQSIDLPGKPRWFSRAGQYSQKWQYWAILGNKIFPPSFHYEIL